MVPIDAHLAKDDLRTKIELYWAKKGGDPASWWTWPSTATR